MLLLCMYLSVDKQNKFEMIFFKIYTKKARHTESKWSRIMDQGLKSGILLIGQG